MLDRTASLTLESRTFARTVESAPTRLRVSAETANQWTHALGLLLSLAACALMWPALAAQPDAVRIVGCSVYLALQMALYAASTLSHSFDDPARRTFFRTLDQVCILLMIAGSFTPFALTHLTAGPEGGLFVLMWGLALAGVVVRVQRGDGAVAFAFFALLGWLPILTLGHVADIGGATGLALVIGGGLAYSGGLWFLVNDHRHPYLHAVWHLCTIAGSVSHFWFLQWYVAEWPVV